MQEAYIIVWMLPVTRDQALPSWFLSDPPSFLEYIILEHHIMGQFMGYGHRSIQQWLAFATILLVETPQTKIIGTIAMHM